MSRIPTVKELLNERKINKGTKALENVVVSADDEFIRLNDEAIESNKDVMIILAVLIMIAPAISMALALINLDIDNTILRIMMTMLIGQVIVNLVIVYIMSVQIKTAIRRTTRSLFLHFSNKDSIAKLKAAQDELDKIKGIRPETELTPIIEDINKKPTP